MGILGFGSGSREHDLCPIPSTAFPAQIPRFPRHASHWQSLSDCLNESSNDEPRDLHRARCASALLLLVEEDLVEPRRDHLACPVHEANLVDVFWIERTNLTIGLEVLVED